MDVLKHCVSSFQKKWETFQMLCGSYTFALIKPAQKKMQSLQ